MYYHEQNYSATERKTLGIHYTPHEIVDYIVRQTLAPFLKEPELLIRIKILDLACGSGLFLLKAFDILAEQWCQQFKHFTIDDARYVIENCLFGIDIDAAAVLITKQRFLTKIYGENSHQIIKFNLVTGNALAIKNNQQIELDTSESTHYFDKRQFDCIISNPPYVRIQNTATQKKPLQASYQTAQGRFDLSSLFIELAEFLLKTNGRLGFIVSNKILTTTATNKLRQFLASHFCIEEIVDLSDTKLFNAAILPLILIAERTEGKNQTIAYTHITQIGSPNEIIPQTDNLLQFAENLARSSETRVEHKKKYFQIKRFQTALPLSSSTIWTFHDQGENGVLTKLRNQMACTLEQLSKKISVGLKTTADTVFIKPMTQHFIAHHQLELALLFPLLESENVVRWRCNWQADQDLSVLYPYLENGNKVVPVELTHYPHTAAYLEQHRTQLEARSYLQQAKRRWYEIWVHHSPASFRQRKIVTPDISANNCFAIDEQGFFVNGTCFFIILKNDTPTFYDAILGLLNSHLMEYFHKVSNGNALYAKRFRYWTSYIRHYPIPKKLLDSVELQNQLAQNVSQLRLAETNEISMLEVRNNELCYQLFNLTHDEIQEIEHRLASFKL